MQPDKTGSYAIGCRLCDQHPTGESTMISFGIKNLGNLQANQAKIVRIQFKASTYVLPKTHKLCVAISSTLFPLMFPMESEGNLSIFPQSCKLLLQTPKMAQKILNFPPPFPHLEYPKEIISNAKFERFATIDLTKSQNSIKLVKQTNNGLIFRPKIGLEYQEISEDSFESDFKVLRPKIEAKQKIFMKFPEENLKILIEVKSKHFSDGFFFHLENELEIQLNDEKFFGNEWIEKIQRNFV